MRGPLTVILERTIRQLPGMIFVAVGMTLVTGTVLVPAWLTNQSLARKHAVLEHQAELIAAQKQRYVDFHDALAAGDPQLLERLAYSQLHVRPADGVPWPGDAVTWVTMSDDRLAATASIDAALAEPEANLKPRQFPVVPPTRLVRLTTGVSRFGLLAAAICFMLGGLWYGRRGAEQISSAATLDAEPAMGQ